VDAAGFIEQGFAQINWSYNILGGLIQISHHRIKFITATWQLTI
jgi:hypothetical protein